MTTGIATIDASNEVDAKVVITTGGADDVVTASASAHIGDNITTGAGNDTIHLSADGVLLSNDTITAGDGTADVISISADSTILDAAFDNVSGVEKLTAATDVDFTALTLGAHAQAAGISEITFTGDGLTLSLLTLVLPTPLLSTSKTPLFLTRLMLLVPQVLSLSKQIRMTLLLATPLRVVLAPLTL